MRVSHASFERSTLRSDLRLRTLLMLSSLGEAFPNQLCKAVGMHAGRLKAVMFGDPPDYSEAFALVPLGLAAMRDTPQGRVFMITDAGRRKARQLTSRWARREEVRRRRRAAKDGLQEESRQEPGTPRAEPHPRDGGLPGAVPPAWSVTWSAGR